MDKKGAYRNSKDLFESEFGDLSSEENIAYENESVIQGIAYTLFTLRQSRHVSREELAEKMGTTSQHICDMESDAEDVTFPDMLKFASALGFSMNFNFFDGKINLANKAEIHLAELAEIVGKLGKVAGDDPVIQEGVRKKISELKEQLEKLTPPPQPSQSSSNAGLHSPTFFINDNEVKV